MPHTYIIPLKLVELDNQSFHLIVEAGINNIKLNMIIDTGASRTVFDRKMLEPGLVSTDNVLHDLQSAGVMADQIESWMAVADTFMIGDLVIHDFPVIMIDLEAIKKLYHKVTGRIIHGLLGSDFLLNYKAGIDYEKLVMTLKNPSH